MCVQSISLFDAHYIVGFFTESPESDNIRTLSACKVLVLSRSHYKNIAADFPGSAGAVLQNLLSKYGNLRTGLTQMNALNVGKSRLSWSSEVKEAQDDVRQEKTVAVIRELIKMHINKQKDEHTTWFCFAASRNDAATITTMIEQGFDPDSSDCEYCHYLTPILSELYSSSCSSLIFQLLSLRLQMTTALLSWSHR